jgi:ATP-binding cassette subfamily B protein
MPIIGAAYGLNLIIGDRNGSLVLTAHWVVYLTGFMIFAVAGRFWFAYLRASTQESIGYEVTAEQRLAIGSHLKQVSMGFFNRRNAGELAAAVTTDLSFLEMMGMKMVDVVVNGYIGAFAMVLCLSFYSVQAALVAAAGIGLSAVFLQLLSKKSKENAPLHQQAQDSMIAATLEYIRGMAVVKAYKQAGISKEGIRLAYKRSKDINLRIERNYVPFNCLHIFSLHAASVGIVLVSAWLGMHNAMELATVLMMAVFSFVIFSQVETINNAAHVLRVIDATFEKLDGLLSEARLDEGSRPVELSSHEIRFDNVTFAYGQRPVLREISFTVPEHKTTAIIGPSGSGKSTICHLIARFYQAGQGVVSIGGVNIREMSSDSVLRNISMVFQKVYLFHDTVRNNICFGKPDACMEEIVEAARKACCHDFIMSLPDGYDTVIGEGGSTLSGGEKQRISIARAMLKNAPIIILDEATASVDPENESSIQQAIGALVQGKTLITIAHRLSTIQNADQILVVDKGCIVQKGTHGELMRQEGLYKRFLTIREAAAGWKL